MWLTNYTLWEDRRSFRIFIFQFFTKFCDIGTGQWTPYGGLGYTLPKKIHYLPINLHFFSGWNGNQTLLNFRKYCLLLFSSNLFGSGLSFSSLLNFFHSVKFFLYQFFYVLSVIFHAVPFCFFPHCSFQYTSVMFFSVCSVLFWFNLVRTNLFYSGVFLSIPLCSICFILCHTVLFCSVQFCSVLNLKIFSYERMVNSFGFYSFAYPE